MKNYFAISRKLFENKLWFLEPFTKAQAWIDLVGNANYKDGGFMVRGNYVEVKRGQLGWSQITMSKRWRWSRQKVRRFLEYLVNEDMIKIDNSEINSTQNENTIQQTIQQKINRITTIISINNYNLYQNDTTDITTDDTTERQQTIHNIIRINKDNKNKITNTEEKKVKTLKEKKLYNGKWTLEEVGAKVVEAFNVYLGTHYKDGKSFLKNMEKWLEIYTLDDIENAIKQIKYDDFWGKGGKAEGGMTPILLFRHSNGENPVNYIDRLLNSQKEKDARRT